MADKRKSRNHISPDRVHRFMWQSGDGLTIYPADPEHNWMTTYRANKHTTVLVQDAIEFGLFVEQSRGDQPAEAFIAAFMDTAQGKTMPERLRADLVAAGVLPAGEDAIDAEVQAEFDAMPKNETREEKWAYKEGDIQITQATPTTVWMTTYVTPHGGEALVKSGVDMILHCQQEGGRRWRAYLKRFMAGPQGALMPEAVRADLIAAGTLR
jgi:hypothetical protein